MNRPKTKREISLEISYEVFGILTDNSLKKLEALNEEQVLEKLQHLRSSEPDDNKFVEKMARKSIAEWRALTGQGAGSQEERWIPRLKDTEFYDNSSGEHYILQAGCCLKNVYRLPENIAQIIGHKIMSYPAVVESVRSYIREQKLLDPIDRRYAISNQTLESIFHVKKIRILFLPGLIKPLLTTPFPGICPCCLLPPSSEDEQDQ